MTEKMSSIGEPLAPRCSLCGEGYHSNIEIGISDSPMKGEYRWIHKQCKRDHDRVFLEAWVLNNNNNIDIDEILDKEDIDVSLDDLLNYYNIDIDDLDR